MRKRYSPLPVLGCFARCRLGLLLALMLMELQKGKHRYSKQKKVSVKKVRWPVPPKPLCNRALSFVAFGAATWA